MNLDITKRWIAHWEGTRSIAYDDATGLPLKPGVKPIGNPTIGVGLNLNTGAARVAITGIGLDFESVLSGAQSLTADQIDRLLSICIGTATQAAHVLIPIFNALPDNKQLVLTDLAFNMGQATLGEFKTMLACIRNQEWAPAAEALQASAWFHQVGAKPYQRGGANVAVLAGANPQDYL